jgi:hypothetical protein
VVSSQVEWRRESRLRPGRAEQAEKEKVGSAKVVQAKQRERKRERVR